MKKIIILIISIILILLFLIFGYFYLHKKNNEDIISNESNNEQENLELNIEEDEKETLPLYVDENPVKIGIYIEKENKKVLITEHTCTWSPEIVMGLFYAVPTQEKEIPNYNFDSLWKEYISNYPNSDKYRIGYNIKFTLNTGEVVDRTILNPDDAYYMFPKVMCFLYDDVNLVPGKRYYHITSDVMYDYTICSSVKLVGDVETKNISSDIELTAFCFDSEDDFDPETNKYRGNSYYTITIKKK